MIYVLFVDKQVILAATVPMLCNSFDEFGHFAQVCPDKIPASGTHHTTKTDLIQGIHIPTPKGTEYTPPIMVPDIGNISAGYSSATIPTVTEAAVSEDTPHTPHPATITAHATLWPMDAP